MTHPHGRSRHRKLTVVEWLTLAAVAMILFTILLQGRWAPGRQGGQGAPAPAAEEPTAAQEGQNNLIELPEAQQEPARARPATGSPGASALFSLLVWAAILIMLGRVLGRLRRVRLTHPSAGPPDAD